MNLSIETLRWTLFIITAVVLLYTSYMYGFIERQIKHDDKHKAGPPGCGLYFRIGQIQLIRGMWVVGVMYLGKQYVWHICGVVDCLELWQELIGFIIDVQVQLLITKALDVMQRNVIVGRNLDHAALACNRPTQSPSW